MFLQDCDFAYATEMLNTQFIVPLDCLEYPTHFITVLKVDLLIE
jgi:hypothetical protein